MTGPDRYQLRIGGQRVDAADGGWFDVENPFDASVVATMARAGAHDTERAVDEAEAALPAWSALTANARANILARAYRILRERRGQLARVLVAEGGKTLAEAEKEVRTAGAFLRLAAEESRRPPGEVLSAPRANQRIVVTRRPVGVVAAFTPANAPANVFGRKAACALAAGCTVVVKPPEETPLSTVLLADILTDAGVHSGAVNVVVGDAPAIAEVLVSSPAVALITFTGSAYRGYQLYAAAAAHGKRAVLELGGVAPYIVFDDADLEKSLDGLVAAKFRMSGQICASPQRVLVQQAVADSFTDGLLSRVSRLRAGDPLDPESDYGPLYHRRILDRLDALVGDALGKGAKLLSERRDLGGLLVAPIVLSDITAEMEIRREEAFGPVVLVERFETEEDAVRMANDTPYGLGGYVFTSDASRAWRVAEALEVGVVGVNEAFPVTIEGPFGGIKGSGFGREGGVYGIEEFHVTKQITFAL